jgi:hypothetical protein
MVIGGRDRVLLVYAGHGTLSDETLVREGRQREATSAGRARASRVAISINDLMPLPSRVRCSCGRRRHASRSLSQGHALTIKKIGALEERNSELDGQAF